MTKTKQLVMLDPDTGAYVFRANTEKLPSVTGCLKSVGIIPDYTGVDRKYAKRGTDVHDLTDRMDQGLSLEDASKELPEHKGYLEAWALFRSEYDFTIIESEKIRYHPTFLYSGKPDRIIRWADGTPGVIDLKTGKTTNAALLPQVSAYGELVRAVVFPGTLLADIRLSGVRLGASGRYSMTPILDAAEHLGVFLHCLAIVRWKRKYSHEKYIDWEEEKI